MSRAGIESGLDLLSNETRLDILRALATQRFDESEQNGLTFSVLFEAVETRDSGNFNYHLKRLLDRLIKKDGECYQLTSGGEQLFSWLQATTYAPGIEYKSVSLDEECPLCEKNLVATYEEGHMDIGCGDHWLLGTYIHPGWVKRLPVDELVGALSLSLQQDFETVVHGICPLCGGSLGLFIRNDHDPYPVQFHYPCEQCGVEPRLRPPQTVWRNVQVEEFYRERGIELHETPPWELYDTYENIESVSTEPPRAEFDISVAGKTAHLTVDGRGSVISFEGPD